MKLVITIDLDKRAFRHGSPFDALDRALSKVSTTTFPPVPLGGSFEIRDASGEVIGTVEGRE